MGIGLSILGTGSWAVKRKALKGHVGRIGRRVAGIRTRIIDLFQLGVLPDLSYHYSLTNQIQYSPLLHSNHLANL